MKRQILLFSSVAVIGAVLAGAPASAQEASASQQSEAVYTGNVITVTARKRDETDLDVPIAIRALGSEQLAKQGIQSLQDVAATTPSLTIASAGGNSGGTITISVEGAEIDSFTYTSASVADGVAASLDPGSQTASANDDEANWCPAVDMYGEGGLGTPKGANPTCG